MNETVVLTTFTDPMMGLSWEQEPVYRRLEVGFGGQVEFRYRMVPLVPDVMRLVDPADLSLGEAEAIRRYNARLAQVYLDEEPIGGVPIVMDGFSLFSPQERSTVDLCLTWEAANVVAPQASAAYLYALRYATIVQDRRTVRAEVALDVARECGLDAPGMERALRDGRAHAALDGDRALAAQLGIHALPVVLVSCGRRAEMLGGLSSYEAFAASIARVSGGAASPGAMRPTDGSLLDMMEAHPLISAQEIVSAFGLGSLEVARAVVAPLAREGRLAVEPCKGSWFAHLTIPE